MNTTHRKPARRVKNAMKLSIRKLAWVASAAPTNTSTHSRILTYHSVGARDHEMNVTPDAFRQQMTWLADNFDVVSVEDALAGSGQVAITFDDGYIDNLTNAVPILSELGLPATFFIVTRRMGGLLDHDGTLNASMLMSWDDVKRVRDLGFSLGGHTRNHARLSTISGRNLNLEIEGCYRDLKAELGMEGAGFAYPFGSALDYDSAAMEQVEQAGFTYALSNRYGVHRSDDSRWEARRIWLDRSDSFGSFRDKLEGKLDALSLLDTYPGIQARRWVNRWLAVR